MLWLLGILVLLALLYLAATLPRLPRRPLGPLEGWDYAHRGLWNGERPENSLPAFRRAAEKGYGIELDVQLTADDRLYVFHDDNLARMTGIDGDIRRLNEPLLEPLRLADSDEPIPTLAQVLRAVDGRVPLIVELKTCSRIKRLCELSYEQLAAYKGPWCMESFDPRAVLWFRLHAPQVIRGQLADGLPGKGRRSALMYALSLLLLNFLGRPDFISYNCDADRNLSMALMRKEKPWLVAWTVRSQEQMDTLRGRYDLQIFERFEAVRTAAGAPAAEDPAERMPEDGVPETETAEADADPSDGQPDENTNDPVT